MQPSKAELAYVYYRRTGERIDGRTRLDVLKSWVGELTFDDYDAIIKLREYIPSPSFYPILSFDHSVEDLAGYLFEETGVKSPVDLSIIFNDHDGCCTYEHDTDRQRLLLLALYQDYNITPPKLDLNDKEREFVEAKGVVLLDDKPSKGGHTLVLDRVTYLYIQGYKNTFLYITIVVPTDDSKSFFNSVLRDYDLNLFKGVSTNLCTSGEIKVKTTKDILPNVGIDDLVKSSTYGHHVIVYDAHDITNAEWITLKKLMNIPRSLAIVGDLSQSKEDHWFRRLWMQSKHVKKITLGSP